MDKQTQAALQATKEIMVKFIEVGRVSPNNFQEIFPIIFKQVLDSLRESAANDRSGD